MAKVICEIKSRGLCCWVCDHAAVHEARGCRVGWEAPTCDELTHLCPINSEPVKCIKVEVRYE